MTILRVTCPRCSWRFSIPRHDVNRSVVCKRCSTWFLASVEIQSSAKSTGRFNLVNKKLILALVAFSGLAFIPLRSLLFPRTPPGPRQQLEDPVLVLAVGELFAHLQQTGAERYVGKVLRVTGSVARIGKNLSGAPLIDLIHVDQSLVFTLRCEFRDWDGAAQVRPGDVVTIDGRCRGVSAVVLLEDSTLRSPGEPNE
jgi:hypothetical protein